MNTLAATQPELIRITFKRDDLVEQINQAGADMILQQAGREKTRGFSH